MALHGRARDIVTPLRGGSPILRAEDAYEARLRADRTIVAITTNPPRGEVASLIGARGGAYLRQALNDAMPDERRGATPLYLILDDIAGASLVAGWAWSLWVDDWFARLTSDPEQRAAMVARMAGVCIGFAPGSSALAPERGVSDGTPTTDLRNPDDPEGWHDFPVQSGVSMRRARRIDVRLENVVVVDAAFQDSAPTPRGDRVVLHEYCLALTADPRSRRIISIAAEPRVLPFPECPSAARNLARLVGEPLAEMRETVLAELKGTAGCTHLNDAVRALAEVPALLDSLLELAPAG